MQLPDQHTADAEPGRGGMPGSLAPVVSLIGGAASLALTLYAGRHNHSIALVTLFALWVLSPFMFLFWIHRSPSIRHSKPRLILTMTALLLTLGSICVYSLAAFTPHRPQAAAPFLIVPLASWIICGIATVFARTTSRSS